MEKKMEEEKQKKQKEFKITSYKIKYSLNRLPLFSTEEKYLIDALIKTKEDAVFRCQVVKDFAQYHWDCYGKYPILAGLFAHVLYIIFMMLYIDAYYQRHEAFDDCFIYIELMLFPLIFATIYDIKQFISKPNKYFRNVSNRIDVVFVILSFANLALQYFVGRDELYQKIIFIAVVAISAQKAVLYMRVFKELSYIVTMLEHVLVQLVGFFIFYGVLVIMIQLCMSISESSISDPKR